MDAAAQGYLSKVTQTGAVAATSRQLPAQAIFEMQAGIAFGCPKEE